TGEEFMLKAARDRRQWFEVYPRHTYRADVGFHAEGRPFVRLLTSNEVRTPPDSVSQATDARPEFRVETEEFARVIGGASYERYARGLARESNVSAPGREPADAPNAERDDAHDFAEASDEYPHR
ncbi:MAG TPA: hypothetical protein VJT82_09185, partial [Pyrinomonadaceae bacterium]|nr:hypothetical protein [Pyrinomonadaceae bacterium]